MNTNTNGDIREQFLHLAFVDRPAVEGSERGHLVLSAYRNLPTGMQAELDLAFSEGRVAVHFSNTSGLGVENDWWEARKERSTIAINYMVFGSPEQRDVFIKLNTPMQRVPIDVKRRFDYIMYGRA